MLLLLDGKGIIICCTSFAVTYCQLRLSVLQEFLVMFVVSVETLLVLKIATRIQKQAFQM